jgi:hypothetical protein
MDESRVPTCDLADVKAKVRAGAVRIRSAAFHTALELEFDERDVYDCILALDASCFYKSMPARNPAWHDCWQDVYKTVYQGIRLYLKFQYFPRGTGKVFIVSFKRDDKYADDSD